MNLLEGLWTVIRLHFHFSKKKNFYTRVPKVYSSVMLSQVIKLNLRNFEKNYNFAFTKGISIENHSEIYGELRSYFGRIKNRKFFVYTIEQINLVDDVVYDCRRRLSYFS